MRVWTYALVATVVAIAALAVAVIAAVMSDGGTSIVDLRVGECFDLPTDPESDVAMLETIETIDCAEPHLAEVVAVGELGTEGREYPTDADLFDEVDRACRAADVEVSERFGLLPVAPTIELWDSFDGRFLCLAIPFGGHPVDGSAFDG